jgi:hypothetical protein
MQGYICYKKWAEMRIQVLWTDLRPGNLKKIHNVVSVVWNPFRMNTSKTREGHTARMVEWQMYTMICSLFNDAS